MSTVDMEVESLKCEKTPHVDEQPTKKCAPETAAADAAPEGCFDCNICLDFAADPVVTFCGHLFCWPCIYRWLQQGVRSGNPQPAERCCPVCKSTLSQDTLVPLYGRGHSGKGDDQGLQIPRRPASAHRPLTEQHVPSNQHPPMHPIQDNYYYPYFNASPGDYTSPPPSSPPLLGPTSVVHSVAGSVLGSMALAVMPWVCRNQEQTDVYFPSPYHAASYVGSSTRLRRRQEMAMGRLLQQIWLFLLFCATLCLLLF